MQLPSVDVFIGLIFLFGIAYSFLLQREKTITLLCSVYIGIVVATNFSETIFQFFNGNKVIANQIWIKSNASASSIAIVIFVASVILISGAINSRSNRSGGDTSMLEVLIYSALAIGLSLATILGFLPEPARNHYFEVSQAAKIIYSSKTLLTVLPPIMLLVLNWKQKKR